MGKCQVEEEFARGIRIVPVDHVTDVWILHAIELELLCAAGATYPPVAHRIVPIPRLLSNRVFCPPTP